MAPEGNGAPSPRGFQSERVAVLGAIEMKPRYAYRLCRERGPTHKKVPEPAKRLERGIGGGRWPGGNANRSVWPFVWQLTAGIGRAVHPSVSVGRAWNRD